jgi:hypothetical protein
MLEQEALKLLIGAIDFVDEQDRRALALRVDGLEQRSFQKIFVRVDRAQVFFLARLQAQELARVVPFVQGVVDVEPFVTLEPNELGLEGTAQDPRDFGLAYTGSPLEEQWAAHLEGEEEAHRDRIVRNVFFATKGFRDFLKRVDAGPNAARNRCHDVPSARL